MKNTTKHSKFPMKKCLIATVVIFLVAFLVLSLLVAITSSEAVSQYSWIFFLVWGIALGISLAVYWIMQGVKYLQTIKDEK